MKRSLETDVCNIFDTQIAASFLGFGEQCSLASLLQKICGVFSTKQFSMSDWSRRPLTHEQIKYALDDVLYLPSVYEILKNRLEEQGRSGWYRSEAAFLEAPETYEISHEDVFRRVRSTSRVKKSRLCILWNLVKWRENKAMDINRPRNYIATDFILNKIAGMAPVSVEDINHVRGLPGGFSKKYGEEIIEVVSKAPDKQPYDFPQNHMQKPGLSVQARQDILRIFAKQKAHELNVAANVLLPKFIIKLLASGKFKTVEQISSEPGMDGWRGDILGKELLSLLTGDTSLALDKDPSKGVSFQSN